MIVKYYNPCRGEFPGDVDEQAMLDGLQIAMRAGVKFSMAPGGYEIEGDEQTVRTMLSTWYYDDEIDVILQRGTTDI